MRVVKVTRKRQITLPKDMCDILGIKPGNYVKVRIEEGARIIIEKALGIDELAGFLNPGYPVKNLARRLEEERKLSQR
ncbi:MAG: AbrB/MazE/SpoVT family DNA-binding domain-containing protein [Thermoprotei archaeon]|nr:MAG: AbrB/MazE/SpoVT family DNA-binding domain-containing protein [Thermoprotei archaeon]